jgi:hypothetical protein
MGDSKAFESITQCSHGAQLKALEQTLKTNEKAPISSRDRRWRTTQYLPTALE